LYSWRIIQLGERRRAQNEQQNAKKNQPFEHLGTMRRLAQPIRVTPSKQVVNGCQASFRAFQRFLVKQHALKLTSTDRSPMPSAHCLEKFRTVEQSVMA
jgi:hypothetical protein